MEYKFKYKALADIKVQEETEELKKAIASVIDLPEEVEKQPDLMYFTAIYVSSGSNLNNAYFFTSEILAAEKTIVSKPMDIEHEEDKIVGHIYDKAITDTNGNKIDLTELASYEKAKLDEIDIHVEIAGVIYKTRFPELAQEVSDGKWKVSMETFFEYYDVKIGDIILNTSEAEALGLEHSNEKLYGSKAIVTKDSVEVANDKIKRALRNLCFSGCGFVKKPANPPSIVLEVSSIQDTSDESVVEDKDSSKEMSSNNVTSMNIEVVVSENKEESALDYKDTVGICVSYKKWVYGGPDPKNPDTEVTHKNWCTLYNKACTSFSRDTTDPDCLRNQVNSVTASCFEEVFKDKVYDHKIESLLNRLDSAISKFKKISKGG